MLKVLVDIGGFKIYSYGLMLVIAFFTGVFIARLRAPKYGLKPDQVWDVSFWALIAGVLGARVIFILQELPYYLEHTEEMYSLRFDGLTSYGGLLGGIIAFVIYCIRAKVPIFRMLDVVAPAVLVSHAIGRVGCLLNGCCYGNHCDLPWAIHVEDAPGMHHPAQIYDSLMNLVGFGIILLLLRLNLRFKVGQMTGLFLLFHGLSRVIYEFWRMDATSAFFMKMPFTEAQLVSALMALVGLGFVYYFGKKGADI